MVIGSGEQACVFQELESTALEILRTQPNVLDMYPKGPQIFCKVYGSGSLQQQHLGTC